jgi:flagellar hook-associated protein 1 FlgK
VDQRESISGVNINEEAANMMRLQQAYQAAAQLISTADSMFQSILSATRR